MLNFLEMSRPGHSGNEKSYLNNGMPDYNSIVESTNDSADANFGHLRLGLDNKCVFGFVSIVFTIATILLVSDRLFQTLTNDIAQSISVVNIQTTTESKPNFIFILADDLGWNSIGYEDFDLTFVTPTLNGMAQSGIIMENYYGQEMCTPSRAALMTGRYPIHVGMQFDEVGNNDEWGLNLTEITFPAMLQENGYATYMMGKWNLGHYSPRYLPTARGFDYFLGFLTGENYYWSKKLTTPSQFEFHDLTYANKDCYSGYNGSDMHTYSTFLYRDKAVDIIKYHDYTDSPMFLYVSFQAVHDPFYDQKFPDGIPKSYFKEVQIICRFFMIDLLTRKSAML